MSKKFKELKAGDKVYYYDHNKIRERVIISVEEHTPSWSNKSRPALIFKHGLPIYVYGWIEEAEQAGRYFASLEALLQAIKRRASEANHLFKKYYAMCDRYRCITENYSKALNEYYITHN